jgi:hypothetical protein
VLTTHGHTAPMVRCLCEQGMAAQALQTEFIGERDDVDIDPGAAPSESDEVLRP